MMQFSGLGNQLPFIEIKRYLALMRSVIAVLGRLLSINLFVIGAVLLAVGTIFTSQGSDLLKIAHETISGRILKFYAPLLLGTGLLTLCSFVTAGVDAKKLRRCGRGYQRQTAVLGFLIVPVALGSTPALIASWRSGFIDIWVLTIAMIGSFGILLAFVLIRRPTGSFGFPWLSPKRLVLLTFVILGFGATTFSTVLPVHHAQALGTLGIVLLVGAIWATVLSCIFIAIPIAYGSPSLVLIPPLTLLLGTFWVDPNVFPHSHLTATSIPTSEWETDRRRTNEGDDLDEWCKQFISVPGDERVPLYLISAEGGGIRAGYWTAAVLAELDAETNGDFRKHAFAFSGVSGGSLGVAAYAAAAFRNNIAPEKLSPIFDQYFANDFLSPIVARLLITEPARVVLGDWSRAEPRDRVFEEALAQDWKDAANTDDFSTPFLEAFGTKDQDSKPRFFPIVWLNSTIVETGLRGIVSNTSTWPYARTSSDMLVQEVGLRRGLYNITVAEAVHLSARFPFVSPPATVLADLAPSNSSKQHEMRLWGHLVDGGYLDNSAADNFTELVNSIDGQRAYALTCSKHQYSQCDNQEILNVKRRIQIIVIAIRNDPFDHDTRAFDVPTLMSVNPDKIPAAASSKNQLKTLLPSDTRSEEMMGPPYALAITRDARGVLTRRNLAETMSRRDPDSFIGKCKTQLVHAGTSKQGISYRSFMKIGLDEQTSQSLAQDWLSAKACPLISEGDLNSLLSNVCDHRADFYHDYSLAHFLSVTSVRNACKSQEDEEENLRGISLGWALSTGVHARIGCMAHKVPPPDLTPHLRPMLPSICFLK